MVSVDAYYITKLELDLKNINSGSLPLNIKLGKIGERFTKYGLRYYLWERGFKVRNQGERTFKIDPQYRASTRGIGGIDFRLEFIYQRKKYDCYIESKNWGAYQKISKKTFDEEILDRFTKNANAPGCIWIVTMNKRNLHLINQRCQQNNIHILPLEEHITSQFLTQHHLTYIMEKFLDEYSSLLNSLTGRKISNVKRTSKTNIPGTYEWDLEIGIPYNLIASKYNQKVSYLRKRNSELRKQGIDLPDRRSREWRGMKFMTKSQLNSYMHNYIREMRKQN